MFDSLQEVNPDMVLFDGLDSALIGFVERFGMPPVALYSLPACLRLLQERDGMSEEEAMEYLDYNILGAYVGEHTPCFATPFDTDISVS